MAIYADEYQRQPNESFYDYLMRMNQLRASGMLGSARETGGVATVGFNAPAAAAAEGAATPSMGMQTVRPLTDAQLAAIAKRDSGGDEYMPERDTPEAQAARRQESLNRQIKVALGGDQGQGYKLGGPLGAVAGPGFGLLGAGFGALTEMYDRSTAALELGKRLGANSPEAARDLGNYYLSNPDALKGLVEGAGIPGIESSVALPQKPSMVERLFGINLGDSTPAAETATGRAPVYDSIQQMRQAELADLVSSSGTLFEPTSDNDGSSMGYVAPSQQPTTSPAQRGGFGVPSSSGGGSAPSGGGTPLSEVGGTTDYANANQDAAYEAMGGFYS